MDVTQRTIVEELQRNARITNRSLADKVGLAPSSTSVRVRDLEQQGVIRGYHADVSLAALGRHLEAMIFVRLSPTDAATVDHFLDFVNAMPETLAVYLLSGVEDALIHVAVPDVQSLRTTVIGRVSSLPEVVDERTSIVFDHIHHRVISPLGEV